MMIVSISYTMFTFYIQLTGEIIFYIYETSVTNIFMQGNPLF
jgi:hypothetical protein